MPKTFSLFLFVASHGNSNLLLSFLMAEPALSLATAAVVLGSP